MEIKQDLAEDYEYPRMIMQTRMSFDPKDQQNSNNNNNWIVPEIERILPITLAETRQLLKNQESSAQTTEPIGQLLALMGGQAGRRTSSLFDSTAGMHSEQSLGHLWDNAGEKLRLYKPASARVPARILRDRLINPENSLVVSSTPQQQQPQPQPVASTSKAQNKSSSSFTGQQMINSLLGNSTMNQSQAKSVEKHLMRMLQAKEKKESKSKSKNPVVKKAQAKTKSESQTKA